MSEWVCECVYYLVDIDVCDRRDIPAQADDTPMIAGVGLN